MSAELDLIGEILIKRVRDKAINDWEGIIDGRMKGNTAERVRKKTALFSSEQQQVLIELTPEIVDTVLHHLLWTVEQERKIDVVAKSGDGPMESVRDASDGLSGELYGERGWIARFSSKPKAT